MFCWMAGKADSVTVGRSAVKAIIYGAAALENQIIGALSRQQKIKFMLINYYAVPIYA